MGARGRGEGKDPVKLLPVVPLVEDVETFSLKLGLDFRELEMSPGSWSDAGVRDKVRAWDVKECTWEIANSSLAGVKRQLWEVDQAQTVRARTALA